MSKSSSAAKIKFSSFDDLFAVSEVTSSHDVQKLAIADLHEFKNHPFKVLDDEKMQETVDSIREHGVLMPGICRPRAEGGYEIISGHRRKHACEILGIKEMPMLVRDYDDDQACLIMVDSNIQREELLPSEKARAYRMKYEAMKHQGSTGGLSLDELGEVAGESAKTVQRYIYLSRLSDQLLEMVDAKKLPVVSASEISFLDVQAQSWVYENLQKGGISVNLNQASKIKEFFKAGELTEAIVRLILEEKKAQARKVVIKAKKIESYFSDDYSTDEIESVIYQLLDEWKAKQGGES